jgi:uncharacterized protein (UPF0332 family)
MADPSFDWEDCLKLAWELAARKEEACLRTSLSRAYYYVFNIALIRAERNGFVSIRNESTHSQLWRLYNRSPEPECISLGQIALRLKEKRERADYKAVYLRIEEDVPEVLKDVQDFSSRLTKLPYRHPNPSSVRQ